MIFPTKDLFFSAFNMKYFRQCNVLTVSSQLVWLGINAFLFVNFYMAFLVERWFYTRVLLGVSLTRGGVRLR